jgi:hypothetical protein
LKLLIDFNLSPKVIPALAELFPGSARIKICWTQHFGRMMFQN